MDKRRILIGDYDTATTWPWTLTAWALTAPEQQTNYVQVPGRSGALDLSTAATGGIPVYNDRTLTATLETSEGSRDDREDAIHEMVNRLDGFRWEVILPDDPDRYLDGRVSIARNYNDLAHASVTITAICHPYKRKKAETVVECGLDGTEREIVLTNGRMPVVPTVTVDGETELAWGGERAVLAAGTHILPGLRLTQGAQVLKARAAGGAGTLTITYREGSL